MYYHTNRLGELRLLSTDRFHIDVTVIKFFGLTGAILVRVKVVLVLNERKK